MEKRKSERVKFLKLVTGNEMQHLWVFRKTFPDSILGLLMDISPEGAQVITGRTEYLQEADYRLVIHTETEQEALTIEAHCCWSRPNGTLDSGIGLVFNETAHLQSIVAALDSGSRWLRCELMPKCGNAEPN